MSSKEEVQGTEAEKNSDVTTLVDSKQETKEAPTNQNNNTELTATTTDTATTASQVNTTVYQENTATSQEKAETSPPHTSTLRRSVPAADNADLTLTSKPSTKRAKGASSAARQSRDTTVAKLPRELWTQVFSYLYPSEMARFAQCSRATLILVREHPVWRKIHSKADGDLPEPKRKHPTHMSVVAAHASQICESCFGYTHPVGGRSPQPHLLSQMPVKVMLTWNKLHAVPDESNKLVYKTRKKEIRLCIACRRLYFAYHPEADIEDPNQGILQYLDRDKKKKEESKNLDDIELTKTDALDYYKVPWTMLERVPHRRVRNPRFYNAIPIFLFRVGDVRELARQYHGGMAGLSHILSMPDRK